MGQRIDADLNVQRFGFATDENATRLVFPHAEMHKLAGTTEGLTYSIADCAFDQLEGRLDTLRWHAEAASLGGIKLRSADGRLELSIGRAEFPRGVLLVRAASGVELLAPHVSFADLEVTYCGPFASTSGASAATAMPNPDPAVTETSWANAAIAAITSPFDPPVLRQERLKFLDGLAGHVTMTVKVKLDLPVIGGRTLDQSLNIPIKDGSIDFRALDKGLDWLEGTFLDIGVDRGRLAVSWGVPIVAPSRDIISCALDETAQTLATFGRVPVRSFADFRVGKGTQPGPPVADRDKKRNMLRSLALEAIDIALSMSAPRSVAIGGGTIMFGGDDGPGLVDLKVRGDIHSQTAGAISGAISAIDTTLKDIRIGGILLTTDRLSLDGIDGFELAFEGFTPTALTMKIHRVTASKLSARIGEKQP